MTKLQTICTSIIDEYGARYERISRNLEAHANTPSADDSRIIKNLYAEIVAAATKHASVEIRMNKALRAGGRCDAIAEHELA